MAFRYTRNPAFLGYAKKAAAFVMSAAATQAPTHPNPSTDRVPLWDYDAKAPEAYKDTSAAAILASGMLELATASGDRRYRDYAVVLLSAFWDTSGYVLSSNGVFVSRKFETFTVIPIQRSSVYCLGVHVRVPPI